MDEKHYKEIFFHLILHYFTKSNPIDQYTIFSIYPPFFHSIIDWQRKYHFSGSDSISYNPNTASRVLDILSRLHMQCMKDYILKDITSKVYQEMLELFQSLLHIETTFLSEGASTAVTSPGECPMRFCTTL